ncbi:hypothetical protein N0V90_000805 [Kalmusia sp. IMI 367209]|nr:hypothetical protein N0V90_000805 [Kalmusia sp. IMI 367209]
MDATKMAPDSTDAQAKGKRTAPADKAASDDPKELLLQLKKEASTKLSPWENQFIVKQGRMSVDVMLMSAKSADIRQALITTIIRLETQMFQYALIKHDEIENYKAQIETYKVEVDLLRQENYELTLAAEMEDSPNENEDINNSEV